MKPFIFKLKKPNNTTGRLVPFDERPSWEVLSSKIAELFNISLNNVRVIFITEADGDVTIEKEQDIQSFYNVYNPSSGKIKGIVQDLQTPDLPNAIHSTWSTNSDLSDLANANDRLILFCWLLNVPGNPFLVDIRKGLTVGHLKKEIKKESEPAFDAINPNTLELWKLSPPIPSADIDTKLKDVQSPQQIQGCVKLNAMDELSEHFSSAPPNRLHIIVQAPPIPSRKHPRSPSAQGDGEAKKKHATSHRLATRRRWTINGGIDEDDINRRYYVDPEAQKETKLCLEAVSDGTYLLLAGARASGKSTRLFWLRQRLNAMGYWALYITFDDLDYMGSTKDFWESFSGAIDFAVAKYGHGLPKGATTSISSRADLKSYFRKDSWGRNVVLLLDEFSCLYQAQDNVRNDCLQAFRGLKHNRAGHAVRCLIAAGTFDIVNLNPSNSGVSPFNITDIVQCPYFTIDETTKLFHEFAHDSGYSIDDDIIEDVWAKSNGHPGMVCLCGRTIFKNMHKLICRDSWTISHNLWQRFPVEELYGEISSYSTFYSMIRSLSRAEAASSVNLLRSHFAGFLGDVKLTDEKVIEDADTLTSVGVLIKPKHITACYQMASPLVDVLIRNKLIPTRFPNAPSASLPLQCTGNVDVLGILIESLKFFDKALIFSASSCSFKTPKVKIHDSEGGYVPRESVYDTELMRILANWLRKYCWSVISQWHDSKRHKYSDIVLKKANRVE